MQKAFALMSVRPGDGDGKPMHYFRTVCRLASLVAYGLSLFILDHVHPIAAKAYDDLCSSQGTTFGAAHSVREFVIAAIIFAVPLFLARSNALIATNLIIGLVTISAASLLLHTARNTPYECFTTMGTYEDHTSGIDGFEFWLIVAAFSCYVLLVIDLAIWGVKRLITFRANALSR
jgi:hypothetical protein